MIPTPGETAGGWWEATGFEAAITAAAERDGRDLAADPDQRETMFHDVPPEVAADAFTRPFEQEDGPLRRRLARPAELAAYLISTTGH